MSKKKIEPLEEPKENPYPSSDLDKMNSIFKKAVADGQTISDIYHFYKKYIQSNAVYPLTNCNCEVSVASYFNKLRDWCSKNGHLFN